MQRLVLHFGFGLCLLLPLLALLLRCFEKSIHSLQSWHLKALSSSFPDGIAEDYFQLHRSACFPVQKHTGLCAARIALSALHDALWGRQVGRKPTAVGHIEDPRGDGEDLGHAGFNMFPQFCIVKHHAGVAHATGEDCRGVESSVDGQFVPADELKLLFRVGLGVLDAAQGPELGQTPLRAVACLGQLRRRVVPYAVGVWAHADACPVVLNYDAVPDLLCADHGDTADDGVLWEASTMGFFDADAILDENNGSPCWSDQGLNRLGVIDAVWQCFCGDDDVVPARWRGASARGINGRKNRLGREVVVAKFSRLQADAIGGDYLVVGAAY